MSQEAIVFGIVGLAVAFLARTWWKTSRGEKGCGACSSNSCGNKQSTLKAAPIQIQMDGRALHIAPREGQSPVAPTVDSSSN